MPTYDTPAPIDLAIHLPVGALQIIASDRADTVVVVAPTNPSKAVDRRGAEETKVEFDGRRLMVTGPKPRFSIIGPSESVDLTIELPSGSRVTADLSVGAVRTIGRLGATRIKASTGAVELDATGDLWLRASHGNATVVSADGDIEIIADHGQIRIGTVTGDSTLTASHGNVTVGRSGGDLAAKLSYGDLEITTALGAVSAKTAYGSMALQEVSRGSIQIESAYGQLTVGVKPGIPAWLDLASKEGRVRSELDSDRAPADGEESVAVRARTQFGDITIRRAPERTSA